MNAIRGGAYIRATLMSFFVISRFSVFLSLITFIFFDNALTARKVFIVSSFYNILNLSMVHFWPMAITTCAEAFITTRRVTEFLLKSEDKEQSDTTNDVIIPKELFKNGKHNLSDNLIEIKINELNELEFKNSKIDSEEKNYIRNQLKNSKNLNDTNADEAAELMKPKRRIENLEAEHKGIVLKNASAVWSLKENNKGVHNIDLNVEQGKLCTVVGLVGSGKSTLLNVIIGELDLDEGLISINGKISYAPQEPWLFEGSIRKNIIFIEKFDEKRYKEVVKVCALKRDFELLPYGDASIVGERGVSLSGGQRARVSLARAIYRQADIYILDDPLSAVDTHVGKHIFEKCIRHFLKDKVCILVTHQLQYLKDVQHVVIMDEGCIDGQGSYKELRKTKADSILSLSVEETKLEEVKESAVIDEKETTPTKILDLDDPEEEKETKMDGSVKFGVYKAYFKSVDNCFMVTCVLLLFVMTQAAMSGVDFFLSQW